MIRLRDVPAKHPLNRVPEALRAKLITAQENLLDLEFGTAGALFERVCHDLRINLSPPPATAEQPAALLADLTYRDLAALFTGILRQSGVPEQSLRLQAANLAHRVQLVRAFQFPDTAIAGTCDKVSGILERFPKTIKDIQCGRNPGDILDPYILAAAQQLLCSGDFAATINATVAHKVLMMIEGLLGHLHEDVLGMMRGNVRAPEPRGDDQEKLDPATNPFPGADVIQPPIGKRRSLRFHQVKSKTGSAKGGDGRRLGLQLEALRGLYGGELFYDALIANTLRGHRSMAGVLKAAPSVVVLAGEAAFRELTGSPNGPELLLRLYQAAFQVAAQRLGYDLDAVAATIYTAFKRRADEHGESFLENLLREAVGGSALQQNSRLFAARARGAGR